MDKQLLLNRIRTLTSPIEPEPYEHEIKLETLEGIECVALDFYGTMFISGVGDIGVDEEQNTAYAPIFEKALTNSGIGYSNPTIGKTGVQQFEKSIDRTVEERKAEGIEYPEPNLIDIWQKVLVSLEQLNLIDGPITQEKAIRFAVEFEFMANKIWPVPNLASILNQLLNSGLALGIISNSQFYTPLAFEALIGVSPSEFGFEEELQKWSYKQGVKKPSLAFYRSFTDELETKAFGPENVLYVGNDLFKDVIPAQQLNMKTALYVGDRRSLRHEQKDLRKPENKPDLIIDELHQISECIC